MPTPIQYEIEGIIKFTDKHGDPLNFTPADPEFPGAISFWVVDASTDQIVPHTSYDKSNMLTSNNQPLGYLRVVLESSNPVYVIAHTTYDAYSPHEGVGVTRYIKSRPVVSPTLYPRAIEIVDD